MSTKAISRALRRQQLDRQLTDLDGLREILRPERGWLYEIRNALGMSAAQLGARVGVRQTSIAKMERSEQEETVSLRSSSRRIADAMDCDVVYALLPRLSLESTLNQQAVRRATRTVARVQHSMVLEDQAAGGDGPLKVQELARELVRTMSPEIWREE